MSFGFGSRGRKYLRSTGDGGAATKACEPREAGGGLKAAETEGGRSSTLLAPSELISELRFSYRSPGPEGGVARCRLLCFGGSAASDRYWRVGDSGAKRMLCRGGSIG